MQELISIIVPVYNVEQYLDRCLNSIAQQTFRNLEVILVDDGSTDQCPEICDRWARLDDRFRAYHKKNGGLSSARNFGLGVANGQYIGFVDSDDWISENMYQKLYNLCKAYHADIAMGEFARTTTDKSDSLFKGETVSEKIVLYEADEFAKKFFKINGNKTIHYVWNKLYSIEVARKIHFPEGLIDEDVEGFFLALCSSNKIVTTSEILYFYRKNENGISAKWFSHKQMDLLIIWEHIVEYCRQPENQKWMKYAKYNLHRAYFGLLCRLCLNEKEEDRQFAFEEHILLQGIRKNYLTLVLGPMPFAKKILLTLMCININFAKVVVRKTYKNFVD